MSVVRLLCVLVLCGCGPTDAGGSAGAEGGGDVSDRIIGVWSDAGNGAYTTSHTELQITEDGSLTMTHVGGCGEMVTGTEEFLWSAVDPTTIEVTDLDGSPMGGYGGDAIRFLFTHDTCNGDPYLEWLSRQTINGDTMTVAERTYVRGEICFMPLGPPPPDVVESPSCQTRWCGEAPQEPPSCSDN